MGSAPGLSAPLSCFTQPVHASRVDLLCCLTQKNKTCAISANPKPVISVHAGRHVRPVLGPIRQQQNSSWLPAVRKQQHEGEQRQQLGDGEVELCGPNCYLGLQQVSRQDPAAGAQPATHEQQQQQKGRASYASSPVPVPGSGLISLKRRRSDAGVQPEPAAAGQREQPGCAGEQEVSSPPIKQLRRGSSSAPDQGTSLGGGRPAIGVTAAATAAAIAAASNVPVRRRSREPDAQLAAGADAWSAWEEALLQQGLEVGLALQLELRAAARLRKACHCVRAGSLKFLGVMVGMTCCIKCFSDCVFLDSRCGAISPAKWQRWWARARADRCTSVCWSWPASLVLRAKARMGSSLGGGRVARW